MNVLNVWLDEEIGLYTIETGSGELYECLAIDEAREIIQNELTAVEAERVN